MQSRLISILLLAIQAFVTLPIDAQYTSRTRQETVAGGSPQESELLLPDLQTLPLDDLLLLAARSGDRKIVRFSNSIANLGTGTAELIGGYNDETDTVEISQKIYRSDGSSIIRGVGEFEFHREHNHWHWDDFALYEVWSVSLDGDLETLVTSSGKVGYCLRDDDPLPVELVGGTDLFRQLFGSRAVYLGCGWQRQGISVGWMDTYSVNTAGQFVDLSGTPEGLYALKSTVDPRNHLLELDESNNSTMLFFSIHRNKLQVIGDSVTPLPDGPLHAGCFLIKVNEIDLCKD